jgi:membrane-associated protein
METMKGFVDMFLHLDKHLTDLAAGWGPWTYGVLAAVVFCETGLVVTPLLPGDSLLFAAGALAGLGILDPWALFFSLSVAAILGDAANYHIGRFLGKRAYEGKLPFVKKEHIDKTHAFYEKYGAKTIVLARFVPIVRTFAPFVAGAGSMSYARFVIYNAVGGVAWVGICIGAGHAFGNMEFVKKNFSVVILGIIFVSVLPMAVEILKARSEKKS